jgi:pyrroline-5-carboxylate reductase
MAERRFGFLGAGRMATALAGGLVRAGLASAESITASDPVPAAREAFQKSIGGAASESNAEAAKADVLVLAVKPQHMVEALTSLGDSVTDRQLVISVAAGRSCSRRVGWSA